MAAKAELAGLKEVREALQEFPERVARGVATVALRDAAKVILDAAQANAPVSTDPHNPTKGSLKASGIVTKTSRKKQLAAISVVFADPAAVPTEYGTTKMSARAWFRPAVDAVEATAIATFSRALVEEVDRAAAKAASKSKSKGS